MKDCILKIKGPLSIYLQKDEFSSFEEFQDAFKTAILEGTILVGESFAPIVETEKGWQIPSWRDTILTDINQVIAVSLSETLPEVEFVAEDESQYITPVDEGSFHTMQTTLDRPPYVYTLTKIYKKEEGDIFPAEEEVALIKNQVAKTVESILDVEPHREFFIRLEPDNAENVQTADPSTFKRFGVVGVLYEKIGGQFKRVYVKSYDGPTNNAQITTNEEEAIRIGWNKSKNFTLTIPDFSNPKYSLRNNPVNADVIAEIQRVRGESLTEPSSFFKVNGFWQEFPQGTPIKLKSFLQGNHYSANIASDSDRIFYAGNLFLRVNGEKVPTNRTPLSDEWREQVLKLMKTDQKYIDPIVEFLNKLLSFKGGDVTFYNRKGKIVAYRHSKKIDGKIIRIKSEFTPESDLDDLLKYAKINVDRFALNQGSNIFKVENGEVNQSYWSSELWEDFYLDHHTTPSRQILHEGKPYFISAKSFLFDIASKEQDIVKNVAKQIEDPKIGNLSIEIDREYSLSEILNNSTDIMNSIGSDSRESLRIVSFLANNEKSAKNILDKKVVFKNRERTFKGIYNNGVIELNYNLITDSNLLGAVLAHEAIHAFTFDWLQSNPTHPITERLNKLIDSLPDSVADYNKNPYEILASITKPEVAKVLRETKIKDRSLLESFIDLIKQLFEDVLGISRTDSVYDELLSKIVTISTQEPVNATVASNKFGLKKRTVNPLPLGYDEESLTSYLNSNDIDKSFLKTFVKSIDADLAHYIYNQNLLQNFIAGDLNFLEVFRNLYNNYVDESEIKTSFTPLEEKFYSLLENADFLEEYWIENTEFAKVRESKIKPSEPDIEDVEDALEDSEKQEELKLITDGEDLSNDKFFERTGMEISSIDAADKISRIFVKMIPSIERVDGKAKVYTINQKDEFLQSYPEQSSYFTRIPNTDTFIKFKTNELGRLTLNDYYYTWNTLADKLEGTLSLEEMIEKIQSDSSLLKVLPEAYVFAERLSNPIKNSFQAEVKQKIESAFKRSRVGIYVVIQDDNGLHLIDESKDIFPTAKNIFNTLFLNNLTENLSSFYDRESGKFNIKKYFDSKKGLFKEDGELDISKAEGSYGDVVLRELGFAFDPETIWADQTNKLQNETYLDFKTSLFKFLSNFDLIDIQIADFITTDQFQNAVKFAGLNAKFKKIVKREDSIKPITTSMMVKNAEGENQSVLSLFNSILKDKKYYNDSSTLEELRSKVLRTQNDMFEFSISKSLMFENDQRTKNRLHVDTLSGKKEVKKGSQSKGNLTVDLSEGDWFLFNYVTMMKGGIIENTRAETATTCYAFRFDTWNKNYQQSTPFSITDIEEVFKDDKYEVTSSSRVFDVWYNYLLGELHRINKGGKTFGLYGSILSKPLKEKLTINNVEEFKEEIAKELSDFFNARYKDYEYFFSLMGGKSALMTDGKETDLSKDFDRYGNTRKAWFDLNAMTLHVEETILFQGDVSQGWKYFKRAKSVQSTGVPLSTSVQMLEWVNNQLNKFSFAKLFGGFSQVSSTYKSATIKDDVKESAYIKDGRLQNGYLESKKLYNEKLGVTQSDEEIEKEFSLLEPYQKTNIGDGDAFISPDFYFAVLNLTGSINQNQIKGFQALIFDMRKNALDYFTKEEIQQNNIDTNLTEEEEAIRKEGLKLIEKGKVVFPKLKFTQRGPGIKGEQVVISEVMDKFALTPLFPQFTKGKPVAHALLKEMLLNNQGYVKFESGTKIANFGLTNFIEEIEKGNLEVNLDDSSYELKSEYLAEQIKTPNKVKEKNTFGSQFRKLIQSGLSLVGLDNLIEQWEKANQEFSNLIKQQVLNEFGIKEINGEFDFSQMNLKKVADILLRESARRDLPENLTVFFDKFKQGELSDSEQETYYKYFEASLGNQQIQNLLASIIKKISIQKLSGAQLIQVSSSIFDRKLANKEGKTRELGFYHFKDGKVQASECKVSMIGNFQNLLNLPEVTDRLEVNGKEDNILNRTDALNLLLLKDEFVEKYKDQLTIVGYRIPTQGLNSMEVMVTREFLPAFYGPTLVCPPEITTQSGTDNDYDKLSVIFPSIEKNGDLSSKGVKEVQNRMIKISSEILLHPINYHKLITPNSPDYIFDKVKPILSDLNIQYEEPKGSMIFTLKGNFSKFRALKGKNLLGVAAVWNTFYSLMQRHKWLLNDKYAILDFKGNTLVNANVNPVLLSDEQKTLRLKDGKFDISIPVTADGTSKAEVISQLINVTVDMPSDDTFGQTNFDQTDFAAGIYASSVLGYDFDSILKLWHQPIIYQYKNRINQLLKDGEKLWKAKLIAVSDLLNIEIPTITNRHGFAIPNFNAFQEQLFKNDGHLDQLENELKLESPKFDIQEVNSQPITKQQKSALAHYLKLLSQAEAIRVVQSSLNFDTSPDNSMMKVAQREENYLKANRIKIIDKNQIDEVKTNSVISGLYSSDILKGVIRRIFPILYSDNNISFFGQASMQYRDQDAAYRFLANDFLLAIVQSFGTHKGLIFNTASEHLQGDKSLDLTKQAKKIKSKLQKEGINLRLLDILIINLSKRRPDKVFNQQIFLGFENSPDDKNKITEEFRTLFKRPDTKDFAETLAIVGLVQSGWTKSAIYFSDLIPEEFITPIITRALDNYTKLTTVQQKKFRALFYENFKVYRKGVLQSTKGDNSESYRLMDYTRELEKIYEEESKEENIEDIEDTEYTEYEEVLPLGLPENIPSQTIKFEEDQSSGYAERTKKNASADATIAIAIDFNSAGEKLTKSSVSDQGKKYIPIDANKLEVTQERVDKIVEQLNSINLGNYKWDRYSDNSYEVSSQGDKRFSALYAKLKDGRTIEEAYQLDVKGYRIQGDNWNLGKGKPPIRDITKEQQWSEYKQLWRTYLNENPELLKDLQEKAKNKVLTDKFASTDVSQARALSEILNESSVKGITLNIAGNGIYTMKGKYTQQEVDNFTYELLKAIVESPNLKTKIASIRTGGQTGFDEAGAKAGIRLGIPTTILAPKGWKFRDITGNDISDERLFKLRFGTDQQSNNEQLCIPF